MGRPRHYIFPTSSLLPNANRPRSRHNHCSNKPHRRRIPPNFYRASTKSRPLNKYQHLSIPPIKARRQLLNTSSYNQKSSNSLLQLTAGRNSRPNPRICPSSLLHPSNSRNLSPIPLPPVPLTLQTPTTNPPHSIHSNYTNGRLIRHS